MLASQGAEVLVLAVLWIVPVVVMYWIVRLAVRHGTLDAYRIDRTDQRIARMQADGRDSRRSPGADSLP